MPSRAGRLVEGTEIDGIPAFLGEVYTRPMFQLLPLHTDSDSYSDSARWPVPLQQHDLDVEEAQVAAVNEWRSSRAR